MPNTVRAALRQASRGATRREVTAALKTWEEGKPCPICHAQKNGNDEAISRAHIAGHILKPKHRPKARPKAPRRRAPVKAVRAAAANGAASVFPVYATRQALFVQMARGEQAYLVIVDRQKVGEQHMYVAYPVDMLPYVGKAGKLAAAQAAARL